MLKIASPNELQAELKSILAFIQGHGPDGKPNRQVVASKLRGLADRVAGRSIKAPVKKLIDQWGGFPQIDHYFGGSRVTPMDAEDVDAGTARILAKLEPKGVWYLSPKGRASKTNPDESKKLYQEDHYKVDFTRMR